MARNYKSYRRLRLQRDEQPQGSSRRRVTGTPISPVRPGSRRVHGTRRYKKAVSHRFVSRWYTPGTGPADEDKVYISNTELRTLISDQLATMLDRRYAIFLADADYYCTPQKDARDIVARSRTDQHAWVAEVYDCDDFAHILKAIFTEAAYKEGLRRKPHCFGIVWGILHGESHAFNWMVNSDRILRFVEPQNCEVFVPGPNVADIQFMLG